MATIPSVDDHRKSVRVLIVDDYEPFRRALCTILGRRRDLQIIAEASDGLEAVQKAQELKPNLIFLDIGLPTMHGIESARQIRQLSPGSRIIFITQESSPDVVQEALSSRAEGYVVKTEVAIDLLAAVDAVLDGRQFVSGSLNPVSERDAQVPKSLSPQ